MQNLFVDILLNPILWGVVTFTMIAIMALMVIKSRYKVFAPNLFVIHIRRGVVKHKSFGGGFFKLPIIDQYFLLPTTIQRIEIKASEKVISKENQEIIVRGFLVWRIEDAEKAFKRITGNSSNSTLSEINTTLEQLAESVIRTTVANMSLDSILRNRGKIVDDLMKEFSTVVATWGVSIETVEIKDVELINQELFINLQAEFENAKNLEAQQITIQTSRAIESAKISKNKELEMAKSEADRELRIIKAQQEEIAILRELEKERKVLEEQKNVALAKEQQEQEVLTAMQLKQQEVGLIERKKAQQFVEEDRKLEILREQKQLEVGVAAKKKEQELLEQERILSVKQREKDIQTMQLEQQREVEKAEYYQKEETIKAETDLITKVKAAEAEKIRNIKTNIEVKAEKERLEAIAYAEANKITAEGQAHAMKVKAEGEAEAKRMNAIADSEKIKIIAEAKKDEMLAEAEGIRAKLEAEADGLEKKVLAQNQISPEVLSQQVVESIVTKLANVLPQIAESMKVGDVKWVNLGGDGNGANPLGIIPKNLVQLVSSMEAFGVDIPGLLSGFLSKTSGSGSNGSDGNSKQPLAQLTGLTNLLTNTATTKNKKKGKPGDPIEVKSTEPEKATA
jgi:regulator of protease activity HflC (stomatin/prohibitin superfamily)